MVTFDVFDFLTRTKKHYAPVSEGGYHGGGDTGLSRAFVASVSKENQKLLGVTPEDVLNSHLLVFAAERSRHEGQVVDFAQFKKDCESGKFT